MKRSTLAGCLGVATLLPAVGLLGTAVATQSDAAAHGHTRVVAECTKAVYEPSTYLFFCDGSAGMNHVRYASYGSRSATGTGTFRYDTCKPNCAAGKEKSTPDTRIRLYRVVNSRRDGKLFTRAKLTFPNGRHDTYHLPNASQ